jgi:two-component system, NtrC family, nitrogen regulation sensor histidine kinase NtrY
MIYKSIGWRLLVRIFLLFGLISLVTYLLFIKQYTHLIWALPAVAFQVYLLYRFLLKPYTEFNQFTEAVQYRDFSLNFQSVRGTPETIALYQGFNTINSSFRTIRREQEEQYLYLQKILELVDTGILSFEVEEGNVVWMNEALKRYLQIPYLKNIHALERRDAVLHQNILDLQPGASKIITIIHPDQEAIKILLLGTLFQTEGQTFKLLAFQNVNQTIEETEAKAWQKLLSVMTHEIMNSVAPIASLANTLKKRLDEIEHQADLVKNIHEDLKLGIDTIKKRSEGLLKFAQTYRNLNKITTLNLKSFPAREIFEHIQNLMQPTLDSKNIELEIVLKEPGIALDADTNLLEQVLINLIINAIEAVKEQPEPRITLSASMQNQKPVLKVIDNGIGIPEELQEQVFVPFFSTRKNGSGIGLSLCKQIMMLHQGNIQVQSVEGKGSIFSLYF